MRFEDKLIKLRREKGLSQEDLGNMLNVSRQSISKWELGQAKPDMNNLLEISRVLNVDIKYLTDDTQDEYNTNEFFNSVESGTTSTGNKGIFIIIGVIVVAILIVFFIGNSIAKKNDYDNVMDYLKAFFSGSLKMQEELIENYEETSDKILNSYNEKSNEMMENYNETVNKMNEGYEEKSEEMENDFYEKKDEMMDEYNKTVEEMNKNYEEQKNEMLNNYYNMQNQMMNN